MIAAHGLGETEMAINGAMTVIGGEKSDMGQLFWLYFIILTPELFLVPSIQRLFENGARSNE